MPRKLSSFRVGRVAAYRRGRIWYLRYFENGRRRQPRVGQDRVAAKQLAAEINSQLEVGAPTALGFEPIAIEELRERWLDFHEHVRRSSVRTIQRYRTATQHLMDFLDSQAAVRRASEFRAPQATEFVKFLRRRKVSPNGHNHARTRRMLDTGVKYILETCSALFNYAQRHRHLPPYGENPFRIIEVSRIPIETCRPVVLLSEEQELQFFKACDDWQFPLFLTLRLTGLRPGELIHLLLPDDIDLAEGLLQVRNKPQLGWQVKTRNEREVPLMPVVAQAIRCTVGSRALGPAFRQRRFADGNEPSLAGKTEQQLIRELNRRNSELAGDDESSNREELAKAAQKLWRDLGALKEDWIRIEFMRVMKRIGAPEITAPKVFRHAFATSLQEANVDPLVRNELLGHVPAGIRVPIAGLGMTAVYTHTKPATRRRQLEQAFDGSSVVCYAEKRLGSRPSASSVDVSCAEDVKP